MPPGHHPLRGPADPRRAPRAALAGVHAEEDGRARAARCASSAPAALDPLVGAGGFDFIADLGAQMPMRTIGMLLGIPEEDQEAIRDQLDEGLHARGGRTSTSDAARLATAGEMFAEYIDWRAEHPSDDLMTELLNAEFEDETGTDAHAHPRGGPHLRQPASPAPATRRPPGSSAGPARCSPSTPTSAASSSTDRVARPATRSRSCCATRRRRRCRPRYVARDVEHHGQTVPEGSVMVLLDGSANRDERQFPDADRFDIHRKIGHHLTLRLRHPLLPRRRAGPPRGPRRARRGAEALPRVGGRLGQRRAGPHLHGAGLGVAPGARLLMADA